MNYEIINNMVYDVSNGNMNCIGSESQYYMTQTTTQTIYQWQKFNLSDGKYEDDTTNTSLILGVVPVNGKVSIEIVPVTQPPTLEDLQTNIVMLNNTINQLTDYIFTYDAGLQ